MSIPVVILMLLGQGAAQAAGWADLDNAFPPLPCQDGWAGCIVDGQQVDSDMQRDSQGIPVPAQARLGWFDLEPTSTFSPFVKLSDYSVEVAVAEVEEDPPEVAPRRDPVRIQDALPERGEQTRPATHVAGPHVASGPGVHHAGSALGHAEQPEDGVVDAVSDDDGSHGTTKGHAHGEQPASAQGSKDQHDAGSKAASTQPVDIEPVTVEPGTPQTTSSTDEFSPQVEVPEVTPPPVVTMARPAPVEDNSCDDLVTLEPAALMGQLSVGRRECLESRLNASGRQTEKDKISRVLLMDAEARGDKKSWARLMKRHLEDIDRSDPDLCFKYAIYLSKLGAGRAHGVIHWADYALENKSNWSGSTYTSRVYSLLRLRAEGANRLWQQADAAYVENRTDENEAKANKYRGMTKDYAREWLDYSRASSQSTKNALALCISAAGSREFCEGG